MLGSSEVPNFKALNPYVTLVVYGDYALPVSGSEMRSVENRRFARVASQSDESVTCIPGEVDFHQFFVDPFPHVDGAASARSVCRMLNRPPRSALSAGIRIIPRHRHVDERIRLAKRRRDRNKHQEKN